MKIIQEEKNSVIVLHISGEMVLDTIRPLRTIFNQCLNTETNLIVLNLGQVRMIDSSGIDSIIFMHKHLRPERDMKIVNAQKYVITIFRRVGLDKIIDISSSADDKESGTEHKNRRMGHLFSFFCKVITKKNTYSYR